MVYGWASSSLADLVVLVAVNHAIENTMPLKQVTMENQQGPTWGHSPEAPRKHTVSVKEG